MRRPLGFLVVLALLAPACGQTVDGLHVVAALYPLAWVAERVGGPWVAVEDLTPAGVEAHDATLSASQRADLQSADVVLLIGTGGFQPDVARAADEASGRVVDVAAGLDLIASTGPLAVDPHLWLDPSLLARTVDAVAAAFAAADPDHADAFAANAAATVQLLATLDAEFARRLAMCDFDAFVTTHEAFTYLARAYGLQQVALEGAAPESEPSATAIEDALAAIADGSAAPAVFAEATEGGRRIGGAIATDAGVPLYGLSTLETDPAPLGYPAVMRANLESLAAGLGCR